MKTVTLLFCGQDHTAGARYAASIRTPENQIFLRSSHDFRPGEEETCNRVLLMPDVHNEAALRSAYPNTVQFAVVIQPELEVNDIPLPALRRVMKHGNRR